jgi:O-antigen ligase
MLFDCQPLLLVTTGALLLLPLLLLLLLECPAYPVLLRVSLLLALAAAGGVAAVVFGRSAKEAAARLQVARIVGASSCTNSRSSLVSGHHITTVRHTSSRL